ncbi:peptidase domain-containing ABC transporter [Staphylococcus pseudintermedius]|uniref:peptidase domain-containing ABC transporter n=1 Tax=Staphylococcus pseudintermedius TaxID=283734 RepID=UPI00216349F0|nr:peptidase domain-containing ABC transporter [Staphylococcus pseudintermedius]
MNIDYSLMKKYYNHVIKLPSSFFDNRKTGEILSRFNDIHNIRESLSSVTVTLFVDLILVLGGSIILYQESGILLLLCSCILPIYIILSLVLKRPFEINNRKLMEESAVLSSYLIESFENNLIIKSYNYENDMYSRGKKRFNSLVNKALKLGLYNNYQLSISNFVNIFISLIVLWVGSYLVIDKELTLGSLIAFNALLIYFLDPFERIINMQPIIQSSIVAIKRVGEIFDLETEKREKSMFRPLQNAIVFNDVCFQYGFRRDILSNVNMTFTKGKKVGIVGSSGSGKSTIGKLLIQLYSCQNGNIYWDGKPIEDLSLMKLRDNIGYVPQDDFWFNGSIIENLTLNKKNVSKEVVIQACKESGAHDFISDLTNKYESIIENGGGNLSGGQKQKLSIARALIKDPDIYIFDEPTSSLDTLSEYKILELLEKLSSNNKTIILISHKLKSIANSDYIYVLKHGRIIEEGSHNELIFNGSEYKSLWEKQCAR